MSKTALRCSAVLIASLAVSTVAQAQTHENAIPNLASADFGWQHGFDGLNFRRVEGKVAPTGRGPVLPGVERLADDQNSNLTPWAATQMRMHNDLVKKGHRAFSAQSRCWPGGTPGRDSFGQIRSSWMPAARGWRVSSRRRPKTCTKADTCSADGA